MNVVVFYLFACDDPKLEVTDYTHFFYMPLRQWHHAGKLLYCFVYFLSVVSFFFCKSSIHASLSCGFLGCLLRVIDGPVSTSELPAICV